MTRAQILPSVMILLSLGSAIAYSFDGDWRKALYWLFAAGITSSVTF